MIIMSIMSCMACLHKIGYKGTEGQVPCPGSRPLEYFPGNIDKFCSYDCRASNNPALSRYPALLGSPVFYSRLRHMDHLYLIQNDALDHLNLIQNDAPKSSVFYSNGQTSHSYALIPLVFLLLQCRLSLLPAPGPHSEWSQACGQ